MLFFFFLIIVIFPPRFWGKWQFYESGVASYYGKGFYFRKTASGDYFLPFGGMTAAHNRLALGSFVLVKNDENGKKVVVKINDRGPFVKGRIIDLSSAAATQLGIKEKGTAKVSLYVKK